MERGTILDYLKNQSLLSKKKLKYWLILATKVSKKFIQSQPFQSKEKETKC